MAAPEPVLADKRYDWIRGKQKNHYSQYGEDGLIGAVLEKIGTANCWCFEVGAADGLFYSNTKLLRDSGWSAVLIEAGDEQFSKLKHYESDVVHCVHETVGRGSLDMILADYDVPHDLDLGVIDVDGQDYHVWSEMRVYKPRIMLVEFFPRESESDFVPEVGGGGQAGRNAIIRLGTTKGYTPVVYTHVNILFVRSELLPCP